MRQIHRQRLARLALALLDAHFGEEGTPRFSMHSFRKLNGKDAPPHSCATSCCFLGYAPNAFAEDPSFQAMLARLPHVPAGAAAVDLWVEVSAWVMGSEYWVIGARSPEYEAEDAVWQFLFDAAWPDAPGVCGTARAQGAPGLA